MPVIFRLQVPKRSPPPPTQIPILTYLRELFFLQQKQKMAFDTPHQTPPASPLSCIFPQLVLKKEGGKKNLSFSKLKFWAGEKSWHTSWPSLLSETVSRVNTKK